MIKFVKYMFVAAIALIAATGCQEDWEDTFSKEPTAPELVNNGMILMTQNTMSESITWAWSAARFLQGDVSYALYVQYGTANAVQVGASTTDLNISMTKTDFRTLLSGIAGVPENNSFDISFYVVASDATAKYESTKQMVKVYAYGDAVSAVVTPSAAELVLDVNNPTGEIALLTWEAARLGYNEAITYSVSMSYDGGKAVEVAKGLTATSCVTTVDELNELAVSAGAPENVASDVLLMVTAYSETYPDGVPSSPVTVKITTYTATYPNFLYIPGSHQGWKPGEAKGIPMSTLTKGLYECYMDLTTADGADVEFKFNPDLANEWLGNEFGITGEAEVVTDKDGNVVVTANLGGDNKNVKAPSGFYRISVNKKLNTLEMVKIEKMGMIGEATVGGWEAETPMIYDAATNTYSVVTTMTADKEYKFRANNNWGYAIGADGTFSGGNCTFDKATGEYKIVLDVNKHPYTVKVLSTSFPEKLYIPGAHANWGVPFTISLQGDGEGHYEGGVNLVASGGENCEWKFSPNATWDEGGDFAGTISLDANGYGKGTTGGNGNITTPNGYYYIKVDMTDGTFEMNRISKVGLIGTINSWGGDEEFTYDAAQNVWTLTQALTVSDEIKVRFNGSWDAPNDNRGIAGDAAGIVTANTATPVYHNGQNMKVAEDGTYTITLDMSTNPNTLTIKK